MRVLWLAVGLGVIGLAGGASGQQAPRVDVVFLLDATGSMGDEIDAVKERIQGMISDIALAEPAPDVRFGVVAYRDREDDYVTRVYPLTRDIDRIVENLGQIEADGGGDYPESLNEGLHVALDGIEWDAAEGVARLVFLIGDAPPHLDYDDDFDYRREIDDAERRAIAVHAIGASGLDQEGEKIYREIAAGTGGSFQWLAYQRSYVDEEGDEITVVVEGRTTTYSSGDSTWTVEGDVGLGRAPGVVSRSMEDSVLAEGMVVDGEMAGGETSGPTTTNIDALVTDVIKAAAEDAGATYGSDSETAVQRTSWGKIKSAAAERGQP
ncbi:MAG: VWA domain-containing protein [Candidatus Latescibacteria bacterium]|nr:VWA domain-containing protein [Candidatus Latescibacterota bacterium]